ncbi:hypothetical protein CC86DRAFT_379726 [Ophiobolus disseminans]|uniref:HTH CENPB-type domain-containing protein n=1 Tax=Ophiobolus disseminans TaxID=1469910 RepID=A0A6A7A8L6_9PLEO|nr:hypothetical protein CC86DRAFT_379726 [Ophiobolus disseminans]
MVKFLLLMSSLGHPVRIKFLPSLAFSIAHRQSSVTTNNLIKPPGKNWPWAFEKRHPELKARRVKVMDWKHHKNNMYYKIKERFKVITKVLEDPDIQLENVYNMDKTGVMLSKLGSVKRGGRQAHNGSAIECISADVLQEIKH